MGRYKAALLVVLAVVIVIASGYSFHRFQANHQIDYTLDFGSVLDAIALLLVGALIEYAYLKTSSDKRADTDLLLKIVEEASNVFKVLMDQARSCEGGKPLSEDERVALTCSARELSNAIHSIEVAFQHCEINPHKLDFGNVKDAREELNESLTDAPFPGPYDQAGLVRIRRASKTMRDELTRIAFAINHR